MSRAVFWTGLLIALAAFLALAPNAIWLTRSSLMITNSGADTLPVRLALADDPDQLIELGEIKSGAHRFEWIAPHGDARLEVDVHDGDVWRRHCSVYVEDAMYRVEITLRSPREVTCVANRSLLTNMLLLDYSAR